MKSKTINLLESIQQNSITNVINKVAEQFKSEIIEEYKASETKEMSTELENKITKALALEGVDSPEDWVADVCSVALDMTPTGEALAIKEDVNYNLGKDVEYLDTYEKAENYNEATNACKINAFKANIDLGEDIYAGTVKLEDGTIEQHYFNVVDNGQVKDHSNIFATGTPKEYAGINLSKIFKEKGYTPNPDGSATGPNGEKLDITITTNGIIFTIDENQVKYEDFIKESINEDENTDIKEQLKQLGIKSIYVSDEHKRADEDELNKLGGLEYNYRLQRNPSKAHYYSYLSINHETLGDIYISFDVETNKIDTTGFPWNFIEKAMTPEIKEFVETNEEFFNNLLKSKELGTGINLNESAILDKIGNIIPEGYKEYMLSNDFTAKTFNSKEKLLKDLKSYNITSFKDAVNNTLTINCKDMYGHRFKTIITWKHLNNKVQESADLKESDGPFSGVEFEKNVPHEMRFKEYNFVNINDLYWVTQQPFSLNQLNQFAEAFKNTKFSKAYVTVRDFSTYDFENDLSRNVFAIIDKYNDIIDPTGYVEAVKKEGWEKILEESEDISNEA